MHQLPVLQEQPEQPPVLQEQPEQEPVPQVQQVLQERRRLQVQPVQVQQEQSRVREQFREQRRH